MESFAEILSNVFSFGTGFLKIVLGVGLVIFVHELGHFLAARWCGVRVETFSLGMGPALFSWKPGPTRYQVAAVPLGGYCRMAGEDRFRDDRAPRPDDLLAKSVGARFFIYSGGVVMNVLFGLIVFPILFHIGVPFSKPTLGEPLPGSPAWHARVAPGSEVVSINGTQVLEFNDILTEIALQPEGSTLLLRDPRTGATHETHLVPRYNENAGLPMIGVQQSTEVDEEGRPLLTIGPDTPAARAGLVDGNALVEVVGGTPGLDPFSQMWEAMNGGETLVLRIDDGEGVRDVSISPDTHDQSSPPMLGIAAPQVLVRDVREGPETERLGLQPEDRLLAAQGVPLRRSGDLQRILLAGDPAPLRLDVEREGEPLVLEGPPLDRAEVLSLADDLLLVGDIGSTQIVVMPGWPGDRAGLLDGDRVLEIDGAEVEDWAGLTALLGNASREGRAAVLQIERAGAAERSFLEITARSEPRPLRNYGIDLRPAKYVYRAGGLGEAVVVGADRSWRFLQNAWVMLKRIVQGNISAEKNVGGIITIAVVSHSYASIGLVSLFFFLAILSINLAFINVLPIPVLDGGHLFFLIVEKIKGSPVSDRILGYSQMVGVVLILSLLVYVTYNDLVRWVFSGWIFRL